MVVDTQPGEPNLLVELSSPGAGEAAADHRVLFDGFLTHPTQAAAALLLLGRVARHRFYLPPGMVVAKIASSDPVVTTSPDQLRFESFSACCGVALRYDVRPGGIDTRPIAHGTTNIDLTGPTRAALTGVQGIDPLHVRITDQTQTAVTFTTLDQTAVEAKAPLPRRWVRGFAEAQAAGAGLVQRAQLTVVEARRFWRALPRTDSGASSLHVSAGSRGLHLTGTATGDTIPLGGPSRLRAVEPLLRFATSVTVYGPPSSSGPGVSLWQLNVADGTLTCALSPSASRGFSGEGGLLHQLAEPHSGEGAEQIANHLNEHHDGQLLDLPNLSRQLDLTLREVEVGLTHLAASGNVGYDAAQQGYFHRELPWTSDGAEALNPRLGAAIRLAADGTLTLGPNSTVDVRQAGSHHRVRGSGEAATCTCPWIAQHGRSRGPCKHILAADLYRSHQDS